MLKKYDEDVEGRSLSVLVPLPRLCNALYTPHPSKHNGVKFKSNISFKENYDFNGFDHLTKLFLLFTLASR